jgi:hypothetical protein
MSDGMAKERLMAIIIGVIMVMSAAGFALNSAINQGFQTVQKPTIPTIVTRPLTLEETVYILNNEGKVIIEFFHAENCTDCSQKIVTLESFAQRMSEFIVLQEVPGNETSLKIIGAGGRINDIGNLTLSDQNLLMTFCDVAIAQPPECLV